MRTSQETDTLSSTHKHSTADSQLLRLERTYDVPVGDLFNAFTSAETLKQWWWPKGLYADRIDLDFREGGKYFINMKGYDRGGGGMAGEFEEIVENQRIVMSDQFTDESGNVISAQEAKMQGVWPDVVYITLEFFATGDSNSRLLLSQEGIPNELHDDCIQGWSESFDKLKDLLEGRRH